MPTLNTGDFLNIYDTFQELATDKRAIQDTSEIIMGKKLVPLLKENFTVVPNIKGRQQIGATKALEYIVKEHTSGCSVAGQDLVTKTLSQEWNPHLLRVDLKMCHDTLKDKFLAWGLAGGNSIADLSEADFIMFITEMVADAVRSDLYRIALMGDKDIATQSILSDASKVPFYNVIDKGLIPSLQYFKTIDLLSEQFVNNEWNGKATKAEQYAIDGEKVYDLFTELLEAEQFTPNLLMTNFAMASAYRKFLRQYQTEGARKAVLNGEPAMVEGLTVKEIKDYDVWRKRDFTDATSGAVNTPHFALATKKDFLAIGVDNPAALDDLRLEYVGGADESFWIKAKIRFDFKIVNPFGFKASI